MYFVNFDNCWFDSLQDTYNLRPGDISQGKLSLSGTQSVGTQLTANDCFELGRQSYNNGDHHHTVQVRELNVLKLFSLMINKQQ